MPLNETPTLRQLADEIRANRAVEVEQTAASGDTDGILGIGKIFHAGQSLLGETAKYTTKGLGYGLWALDQSRQWVAKPVLGSMVVGARALNGEDVGDINGIGDLRKAWDEADIPGPIRFVAEMAADPVSWVGMGWAKTAGIKAAELAGAAGLREAGLLGAETATKKGGFLAHAAGVFTDPFKAAATAARAEFGFSPEARTALTNLSKGVLPATKEELASSVGRFLDESIALGITPAAQRADRLTLLTAHPELFESLKPGRIARLFEATRVGRIMGPVDVFAEHLWGAPFKLVSPVLAKPFGRAGEAIVNALDNFGNSYPIKAFTWVGSKFGPVEIKNGKIVYAPFHAAQQAAKDGKLGTWLFNSTFDSLGHEAARTSEQIRRGLGLTAADVGIDLHDIPEVMTAFRKGTLDEAERIAPQMDTFARDQLWATVHKLDDEAFTSLISAKNQDTFMSRLFREIHGHLADSYIGLLPKDIALSDVNIVNRAFGWAKGAVNVWKPWVTSANPSFQLINFLDGAVRTGGFEFLNAEKKAVVEAAVNLGFPIELTSHVRESLPDTALKVLKGQKIRIGTDVREGFNYAKEYLGRTESQFGIKADVGQRLGLAGMPSFIATHVDQLNQVSLAMQATHKAAMSRILGAGLDDSLTPVKQFVETLRTSEQFNPQALDQIEKFVTSGLPDDELRTLFGQFFSIHNLEMRRVQGTQPFSAMPQIWQDIFHESTTRALRENPALLTREAMGIGFRDAMAQLPDMIHKPLITATENLGLFEKMLRGEMDDAGIEGIGRVRAKNHRILRETMTSIADVAETFNPELAAGLREAALPTVLASRQADAIVFTGLSHAAKQSGMSHMSVAVPYFSWEKRVVGRINQAHSTMVRRLEMYHKAVLRGDEAVARSHLRILSRQHGGFRPFFENALEQGILPPSTQLREQLVKSSEEMMANFVGQKYRLGDAFGEMLKAGHVRRNSVYSVLRDSENEVFRQGDIAAMRIRSGQEMAALSGNAGQTFPVNIRPDLDTLARTDRDLKNQTQALLDSHGFAWQRAAQETLGDPRVLIDNPEIFFQFPQLEKQFPDVAEHINKILEGQKVRDGLIHNPPTRPWAEVETDIQNIYGEIGRSAIKYHTQVLPKSAAKRFQERAAEVMRSIWQANLNDDANIRGIKLAHEQIERFIGTRSDKAVGDALHRTLQTSMREDGIPFMRNRMVDYTRKTNFQDLMASVLPFASFQMHLPGYIGRTLMERPGVIQAMNHFGQEAQDATGGPFGGLVFGYGGYVLAPQLRFSYLPILAGQNFVNPDDHPLNQFNDMVSLFGFSPGPNVQLTLDAANKFADQSGINKALGLEQATPEFRGGILPQWRAIQDITAVAGINNGSGLSVPIIGPSTDIREREVARELAGRMSQKIEQFTQANGRPPYEDEVVAIREALWTNELDDARKAYAARDLPSFLLPGLKAHNPDYEASKEKVATWMRVNGIDDATSSNWIGKYKSLDPLAKNRLQESVPEVGDLLAIPPYAESGQDKAVRTAREKFYRNSNLIQSRVAKEQRALDAALTSGKILPKEYRDRRSTLRSNMSSALSALETSPDYRPFMERERAVPSKPEELAYLDFQKLEPQDIDGDGVIGTEDMKQFFDARDAYYSGQPRWVQDYIDSRREVSQTPTEREFTHAQKLLNTYFDIPKYLGLSTSDGEAADSALKKAQAFSDTLPGQVSTAQVVMTLPTLSASERVLALRALAAPRNPQRYTFFRSHDELGAFFPDLSPAEPRF